MSVQQVQLELDSNVRRIANGTALLGGSPYRLIRLSAAGSKLLDGWLAGSCEPLTDAAQQLRTRLIQAGMVHPVPESDGPMPSVSFVVPVYDDPGGVDALLSALRRDLGFVEIVVVDDASPGAAAIEAVVERHEATLIRHTRNQGPAAARNTGWRSLFPAGSPHFPDITFFIDADVRPTPGSLRRVLRHLADPSLSAAAPRVQALAGHTTIDSYEAIGSPLDLGDRPGLARPRSHPGYVPSAALAVRTQALIDTDGFDETMRYGEDVDLIWRLADQDLNVRYVAEAVVHHRNRDTVLELAKQRFGYGSSAGTLAHHHGESVTPLRLPATILAGWLAALFGGRLGVAAGLAGAAWSTRALSKKLDGKVDEPITEATRLMTQAHVGVAGALVNAANRHYVPLMLLTRATRRWLVVGAIVPPVFAWLRSRPRHDPITHVVLKAVDDTAYCAGVWAGAWRERSPGALLPVVHLPGDER